MRARDDLSEEDALARINAQLPITEKKGKADYVIDNSGTVEDTLQQVDTLYHTLKSKAETRLEE